MIDFQSSAIAKNVSYRPCHSPSPGGDLSRLGSGERNLAEPKVAWRPSKRARQSAEALAKAEASQRRDEGELNHCGRQSALIQLGRARDASLLAGRPLGHSVILSKTLCLCALAHSREESVFIGLPAEALAKAGVHPLATFHVVVKFAALSSQIIKPIQSPEGYCAEPG
jgi:hypothetical protein